MRRHHGRGGSRQPGFAMLLLLGQMAQFGFDRIPPVTLGAIAAQVAIFLRVIPELNLPSIGDVCVSAIHVWYHEDWKRLFLASFFHLDEWHLYYNMVSLLWKGVKLERKFGSKYFLYMVAVFSVAVNAVLVGLSLGAEHVLHDYTYARQCAAGFSGVLFALKVVLSHTEPAGVQRLLGFIPVPSKLACWAELVLIHILVPNSSFIGHLAGILVGLIYIKGPLKTIMDFVIPADPSYTYQRAATGHRPDNNYRAYNRADNPRYASGHYSNNNSENRDNYSHYTAGMSEDEQIRRATDESLRERFSGARASPSAPPGDYPAYPHHTPYPPAGGAPPYPTAPSGPSAPPQPPSYEDVERERSQGLYPDLSQMPQSDAPTRSASDADELRRRRLARFDH